jgi:hypothetical protein
MYGIEKCYRINECFLEQFNNQIFSSPFPAVLSLSSSPNLMALEGARERQTSQAWERREGDVRVPATTKAGWPHWGRDTHGHGGGRRRGGEGGRSGYGRVLSELDPTATKKTVKKKLTLEEPNT